MRGAGNTLKANDAGAAPRSRPPFSDPPSSRTSTVHVATPCCSGAVWNESAPVALISGAREKRLGVSLTNSSEKESVCHASSAAPLSTTAKPGTTTPPASSYAVRMAGMMKEGASFTGVMDRRMVVASDASVWEGSSMDGCRASTSSSAAWEEASWIVNEMVPRRSMAGPAAKRAGLEFPITVKVTNCISSRARPARAKKLGTANGARESASLRRSTSLLGTTMSSTSRMKTEMEDVSYPTACPPTSGPPSSVSATVTVKLPSRFTTSLKSSVPLRCSANTEKIGSPAQRPSLLTTLARE
mmetsp:Transcript_4710/g.11301  ORF Transcript_4710/g.11301 Transcript_4710/m.11301 type:complete len:300 (-) Transcript_4710:512-1411(-)